jgi:hypothetical protein
LAYDTIKNAMSPATRNAARIGIAKIMGVPNTPESTSDRTVVGSNVSADTCSEDDITSTCTADSFDEVVDFIVDTVLLVNLDGVFAIVDDGTGGVRPRVLLLPK